MENSIQSWAQSSQDSTQIANTIKGIVLTCATIITFGVALFFHVNLTADNINALATDTGVAAGAIWTVWGLGMKFVSWLVTIKQPIATS